jgi:DegV family protein with EDD domain
MGADMKIAVVTDSGSNIYHQGIEMEGLFKLPLQITDGVNTYLEGETITIDQTYQLISEKKTLMTSLPPLGRIEELFETLKEHYDGIFAVPICPGLSGTLGAMQSAAMTVGIPFDFIDCYSIASNELHLAISARKMFDAGKTVKQVRETLQAAAEDSVTLVIADDLPHLARNGRVTPLAASIGGLFKIKPVLIVNKGTAGKIDVLEKVRTMPKALESIIDYFKKMGVDEHHLICVAHVWAEETGRELLGRIEAEFPTSEVFFVPLISTVGVNTGLGCVGCQAIRKVVW